jgi:hypothetical protein
MTLVAASAIFAIVQYQRTQAALQVEREAVTREQRAAVLLQQGHLDRIRQAEEEAQRARVQLDEVLRKRDSVADKAKNAQQEADQAREVEAQITKKAIRHEVGWWRVTEARLEAKKKREEAERLAIVLLNADKAVREAQVRHADAAKAAAVLLNKPAPESVASSVEGTLEAEREKTERLRSQLDEKTAELTNANTEIARLKGIQRDLNEKLEKLKLDHEITRRELEAARKAALGQRFATPPANMQRPTSLGAPEVYND